MEETNKKYTAKDFDRYHSGAMAAHEMHALEKAALEDPFLADALEGYSNTAHFEGDIAELKNRLKEKERKKNVFSIATVSQNRSWRIAALFIVIAGGGFLFYRINLIKKENSIVRNEIKTSPGKKENIAPATKDSTTANNDIAFEERPASKKKKKGKQDFPKPPIRSKKNNYAPEVKTQSEPMISSADKSKDTAVENNVSMSDEDKVENNQYKKKYELKGNVTDITGAPVPNAAIYETSSMNGTLTDANGNFMLESSDSIIFAQASAVNFYQKEFILQKNSEAAITLNMNQKQLTEVVILGYSKKARRLNKSARSKKLQEKIAESKISKTPNKPFPKNEKFDQYLKEILVPLIDSNNKQITGEVKLSFTLSYKGRPENIKVISSSCIPCEKLAVAILEKGPDWENEKQDEGTTVITFK